MTKRKSLRLRQYPSNPCTAYLELLAFPEVATPGLVKRSINIHSLIEGYEGPGLCVDFDAQGVAVGIEILYPTEDDEV